MAPTYAVPALKIVMSFLHVFALQVLSEVLPEVQPELFEERGQPSRHASLPGGAEQYPQRGRTRAGSE